MTTKTVKLLVLIALFVHGIGHIQGIVAAIGVKFTNNTSTVSWLLKGLGENTNRSICIILYFGAVASGILAGLAFKGILVPETAWQIFALTVVPSIALMLLAKPPAVKQEI